MLRTGRHRDSVIARMRSLALNKVESIKLLRDHGGLTLHDAKDIVHLSPAWADRFESEEAFHDAAEEAFEVAIAHDKLTAV